MKKLFIAAAAALFAFAVSACVVEFDPNAPIEVAGLWGDPPDFHTGTLTSPAVGNDYGAVQVLIRLEAGVIVEITQAPGFSQTEGYFEAFWAMAVPIILAANTFDTPLATAGATATRDALVTAGMAALNEL